MVLMVVGSSTSERGAPSRRLAQDVLRALAAIALGFLSGLLIGLVIGTLNPFYVLWTALIGPTVFLVLLLGRGAQDRQLYRVRRLGALGGWILFLVLFWFYPLGVQWLFSFRSFAPVPGSLAAAGFVAIGETVGDKVLQWIRMARLQENAR